MKGKENTGERNGSLTKARDQKKVPRRVRRKGGS